MLFEEVVLLEDVVLSDGVGEPAGALLSEDGVALAAGALPLSRKSLTYQPEPLS